MRKTPVGNRKDAAKALKGELDFLGSGSWRRAYVKDNVVYKVEYGGTDNADNNGEYKNYKRLSKKTFPANLKVPQVTQWTVEGRKVNAMPLVDGPPSGQGSGLPRDLCDWLRSNGLTDIWYDNIKKDANGVFHIVDIQF